LTRSKRGSEKIFKSEKKHYFEKFLNLKKKTLFRKIILGIELQLILYRSSAGEIYPHLKNGGFSNVMAATASLVFGIIQDRHGMVISRRVENSLRRFY